MLLKIFRFITLIVTALSLSLSICHLFEMPVRLNFESELWVRVTVVEGIFRYFGLIGAFLEVGSIIAAIVLAYLVRRRRKTILFLSIAAATCLVLAFASWIVFVATANAELATWLTKPVPPDFDTWRRQWEFGHAASAIIKLIGFGFMTASVVFDTEG